MKFDALTALKNARGNPDKRFPGREDTRFQDGLLVPSLRPKFQVNTPAKVFTIGSCFARNIELVLRNYDVELPTMDFAVPKSEWPTRPNGLLNEYNAGTISQRILSAIGLQETPEETIVKTKDGFVDLLLPGNFPVSFERAVARRSEIEEVYENLVSSDLVVITLGLIEAWYDEESEFFLNRMPTHVQVKSQPDRYSFRRLDADESFSLLDRALAGLIGAGIDKVLLTVSPVPLGTTFTNSDVVVASSYSKAVLRVCSEKLSQQYAQVDYLPSFEMVTSGGLNSFNPDNIHVQNQVVKRVTDHMLSAYFPDLDLKPETGQQAVPADASI